MAGQLVVLHEALAEQLRRNVGADINYLAWPDPTITENKIEVWPDGGGYFSYWHTAGPDESADVMLRLRIRIHMGDAITAGTMLAELLSNDAAAQHSVVNAVLADITLDGVVDRCEPVGEVEWDVDEEAYAHIAWITLAVRLPC